MISDRYYPETRSAAHLFQDLAEGLVKRGHDVAVLTKMPTENLPGEASNDLSSLPYRDCIAGVTVIRVPGLFSMKRSIGLRAVDQLYFGLRILWRALISAKPDVMVVYSPPLPLAVAGALYSNWSGVPFVLNLHDLYPRTAIELGVLRNKLLIWVARRLESFAYRNAAQIVVPAQQSQRILTEQTGVDEKKVHLVFNWIDTRSIVPDSKRSSFRRLNALTGRFVVSYAGLMGLAQDLTNVIECARRMRDQSDVLFLLVGDGVYAERWKDLARGLENVRFLPSVPRDVYLDVLRASDVCLVPLSASLKSPAIPGKLQSIMAVAKPVIAIVQPDGDAAQMVWESKCGFVVAPGDISELQRVLLKLLSNPTLAEELGRNGRQYAEQQFNLDSAVSTLEKVLGLAI